MKGKNSNYRYKLYYYNLKNEEWIFIKKYTNLSDICEKLKLSRPTCRYIMNGSDTKYTNIYKIKEI